MKNIICFNNQMEHYLVINEEQEGNSVWFEIDCDENTGQELQIMSGEITVTVSLTSGVKNTYQLITAYWNYGDVTQFRLVNDDFEGEWLTLRFPRIIDTDASVFWDAGDEEYKLQGAFNVLQSVEELQSENESQQALINDLQIRVLSYILPSSVSTSAIPDGSSSNVLIFKFNNTQDGANMTLGACLSFETETTVDSATETYGDCLLTINFVLDGNIVGMMQQSYGGGKQILTLNYLVQSLDAGDHTFIVNFATSGGSIS